MVTSSDVGMTGSENSGPYCPILDPDYAQEKGDNRRNRCL